MYANASFYVAVVAEQRSLKLIILEQTGTLLPTLIVPFDERFSLKGAIFLKGCLQKDKCDGAYENWAYLHKLHMFRKQYFS